MNKGKAGHGVGRREDHPTCGMEGSQLVGGECYGQVIGRANHELGGREIS